MFLSPYPLISLRVYIIITIHLYFYTFIRLYLEVHEILTLLATIIL